ncbi:SGNH/GDSL hydrolase family protein [Nocardia sp. NEAU-351]|uniref:SGNH/GDSL hydrolase family protein n=1 Tax=Nocardia bovistercoris TaxID=2785916 RepID=A0A931IGD8_9NOCA|nr:SGNH/GDSL hydrolase family protein [Nocardia bovistercoris]
MRPFTRYVALGDSRTVGVGDPDGAGGYRGWADRFAELLGALHPEVRYANLAVRDHRVAAIRSEQVDAALAHRPDLVTVLAGMNDIVRPRWNRAALAADLDVVFGRLIGSSATVVSFTVPDIGAIAPMARPLSTRIYAFNDEMRELADEHGVVLIDIESVEAIDDPAVWAEDRLHLDPLGHDLLARAVADTLRLPGADDSWRDRLPGPGDTARGGELRWAARHLLPRFGRAARDGAEAKRPDLLPVFP